MMQKFFLSILITFSFLLAEPSKESQFLELMQHELSKVLPDFQTVSSLIDGGPSFINHVYLITLKDGKECIIKIGNPIWKGDKTLNEVTALKYLKSNTLLPVPEVLAYECCRENFLENNTLASLDTSEPFVFSHQDFVMKNILFIMTAYQPSLIGNGAALHFLKMNR